MALKCFRALWGAPTAQQLGVAQLPPLAAAAAQLRHIRAQGYDGVEASVADLRALGGGDLGAARQLLAAHELRVVVGVYSGWTDYEPAGLADQFDGVQAHVTRLRQQLECVRDAFPDAVRINAHSGADRWTRHQQLEFLARALELEQEVACAPVCHETHRGRVFFSPWNTLELLEAFPSLQLTLDFSHWCVVSERLLDTPQDREWLRRVLPHVRHVHGRVGSDQSAQLAHPDAAVSAVENERFERLWTEIWQHQHAVRAKHSNSNSFGGGDEWISTFTPEYGPIPYAPRHHGDLDAEAYDVDQLCTQRAARERERFREAIRGAQ